MAGVDLCCQTTSCTHDYIICIIHTCMHASCICFFTPACALAGPGCRSEVMVGIVPGEGMRLHASLRACGFRLQGPEATVEMALGEDMAGWNFMADRPCDHILFLSYALVHASVDCVRYPAHACMLMCAGRRWHHGGYHSRGEHGGCLSLRGYSCDHRHWKVGYLQIRHKHARAHTTAHMAACACAHSHATRVCPSSSAVHTESCVACTHGCYLSCVQACVSCARASFSPKHSCTRTPPPSHTL